MYIKEIKMSAFKSFADKISINLDPTFTGIVGPNGSGKSNILDAIRWVLGEQSVKTLRGSAGMTDVIFGGSKSRNAANQAFVSIVFDNTDKTLPIEYNEVSIKRMVYRSGENEYYLNNEKCRLKDITDLFVDSFSSRESFNIIPQNKIEEILSDRPEDRRIIFEEAAGVLKYKKRKEETLRKLSKTHENVDRLNMIIDELEVQVGPLERASKKAIEYKESKEKLESVEVALIVKDITQFNELFNAKKEEKDALELEFVNTNKMYSLGSAEIEKKKIASDKLEEKLSELREELSKNKELLSDLMSKKELSIERSKYDKDSNEIKSKIIELKDNNLKLDSEINSLKEEIKNINLVIGEKEEDLKNIIHSSNVSSKEIDTEKFNYNNLKRKELENSSKIELLERNLENMSSLPYSVKSVLGNPTLKGINNIIGNVINTKSEYATMLDVSLGASTNYIIVDNDVSAKEAINYLKNNNKGRATFFPLTVIKPKSIEPTVSNVAKKSEGYIGIASELVEYDTKYYNIVMNQLGNIIVADNIDNALKISKDINHRYRVVTLSGEILHVGGSLTGGSVKSNNSYIIDKYEIDKLKVLLEHIRNNIGSSETKLKEYENDFNVVKTKIMNANIEIVKIKEQLKAKEDNLVSLTEEYNRKKSEINDLCSKNKDSIDKNIENIMNEYYKVEKLCNSLNNEIEHKSKEKRDLLDEINERERELKKNNTLSSSAKEKMNTIEIETVKLNMALDNLLNRLSDEYSLTYEGAKGKYLLEIDESEARGMVSELKRIIKSLGNVNLESIEEYERVNKRFTFLNSQKDDLLQSEKDLLEIINNMDAVMADKFESTFNNINKEFNKVFTNLFGGGEASLKLTDPLNILETGIEIMAIPPGKNMKSISLLSGGEKTLTAISLLFSIMNLKKVPFVVLDEVESALDEVNAEKFGNYLSNYKNKTQMLIITHKKKTMEFVDLLYGVTMQESGVSKLVSVKLENMN